jgi:hypothetical protein
MPEQTVRESDQQPGIAFVRITTHHLTPPGSGALPNL